MKAFPLVILMIVLLSACSSSPSPVLPPLMLKPFTPEVRVVSEWHRTIGVGVSDGYLKMPPALAGTTGYAADAKGKLVAFNVHTGSVEWSKRYVIPFSNAPVISGNTLFLGTLQGELIAINKKQGDILWRKQLSSEVLAPVAANGDIVVAKTVDGSIEALRASDGKQLWIHTENEPSLTLRGQSAPVISNDMLIYASDDGKISALTLRTGTELWTRVVAVPQGGTELARMVDIDATPVIYDDTIYVAAYQGRLVAINLLSGRIIWVRELSTYTGLAVDAYRLYMSDSDGVVWALDRKTGATLWKQAKLLRRSVTAPVLQNGYVAVADFNGFVHWLAREDGHMVARTRLSRDGGSDEREDFKFLKFSKWNNILAVPRSIDSSELLVMDRTGWLESFKLELPR